MRVVPQDASVRPGTTVHFAAYPCDQAGTATGAAAVSWSAHDDEKRDIRIAPDGAFLAEQPGVHYVTARADHLEAMVSVTVLDAGDDIPPVGEPGRAAARAAMEPVSPWNDTTAATAFEPANRVGRFSASDDIQQYASDQKAVIGGDVAAAGSGNFQLEIPLIALPGRGGSQLDLRMTYNSRLWHEVGQEPLVMYDVDGGWPGPGWSLGYGRVVRIGALAGSMVLGLDGTRHPFRRLSSSGNDTDGRSFTCATADGTAIDYFHKDAGSAVASQWAQAVYPDGTFVEYMAAGRDVVDPRTGQTRPSTGVVYPTRIRDAQGNISTITYRQGVGPQIDTIVDCLGRAIVFHYDAAGQLTAITAPGLGAVGRTVARFNWTQLRFDLTGAFSPVPRDGDTVPRAVTPAREPLTGITVTALAAAMFPGTSAGYWFGDAGQYSPYGMLTAVREHRGMGFDGAPLDQQGTITAGTVTRERVYDYPSVPAGLATAPTYSTVTETWKRQDSAPAITTYLVQRDLRNAPRRIAVRRPDGSGTVTTLRTQRPAAGYPETLEVYDGDRRVRQVTTAWEEGEYGAPRVSRREITDERGLMQATEYIYGQLNGLNRPTEVRELDYAGTRVRTVSVTYKPELPDPNSPRFPTDYLLTHVFGLPTVVEIAGGDGVPLSRVELSYDGELLQPALSVPQHAATHDPSKIGAGYDPQTDFRGNLTQTVAWTDPAARAGPVIERRTYDISGNLVAIDGPGAYHEARVYIAATGFGAPERVVIGAPESGPGDRNSTTAAINANTGLVVAATDANGRATTFAYDPESLRPDAMRLSGGATVDYAYDDALLEATVTTRLPDGSVAVQAKMQLNGLGLPCREDTSAVPTGQPRGDLRLNVQIDADFGGRWSGWRSRWPQGSPATRELKIVRRPDGRLHAVAVDADQQIWQTEQLTSRGVGGEWSPWSLVSAAGRGSRLAVASGEDGRLHAFIVDLDRQVRYSAQLQPVPEAPWTAWTAVAPQDGARAAGVHVATGPDGRIHAFKVDEDRTIEQTPVGAGAAWELFSSYETSTVTVSCNGDGGLQVFLLIRGGVLLTREQIPADAKTWTWADWVLRGDESQPALAVTVAAGTDGRLHAFALGLDGQVRRVEQLEPAGGSEWSGWTTMGASPDGGLPLKLSVLPGPDGRLHALLISTSRLLWHSEQFDTAVDADWTSWEASSGTTSVEGADAAVGDDGRLHAVAAAPDGQLHHSEQADATFLAPWTEWTRFDRAGDLGLDVTVTPGPSGALFAFSRAPGERGPVTNTVLTEYDVMGRRRRQSLPLRSPDPPAWTTTSYDALGRITAVRAADGGLRGVFYDEQRRPVSAFGRPVPGPTERHVDPQGRERWLRRDALGRVVEIIDPLPQSDGSVFTQVVHPKDPNPRPTHFLALPTVRYTYDALDRVTEIVQSSGSTDVPGGLAAPSRRRLGYDGLGRVRRQRLAERRVTLDDSGAHVGAAGRWSDVFDYDDRSRPVVHTDARGVRRRLDYGTDALGRLQSITFDLAGAPDATSIAPVAPISYHYVPAGDRTRVERVETMHAVERRGYDELGRLRTTALIIPGQPDVELKMEYLLDALDRLEGFTYPRRTTRAGDQLRIATGYGIDGRINRLQVGDDEIRPQYTPGGDLAALTAGSLRAVFRYDTLTGSLSGQELWRDSQPLLERGYHHAPPGRPAGDSGQLLALVDWLDPRRSQTYSYDALGRLQRTDGGDGTQTRWRQDYWYDHHGNRTSVIASGDAPNGGPIPADGIGLRFDFETERIAQPGFEYDDCGNLTRAPTADGAWQRYRYDAAGRLAAVTDDAGADIERYEYLACRRRRLTTRASAGERTAHLWDGDTIISEHTLAGGVWAWRRDRVFFAGRLLATWEPAADPPLVRLHHPDRLGTAVVTDPAGADEIELSVLPYGTVLEAPDGTLENLFASYQRSQATGLDYAVNRSYHPYLGRFLEPDPLGLTTAAAAEPRRLNGYAYALADPINVIDPTGLICFDVPKGVLTETVEVNGLTGASRSTVTEEFWIERQCIPTVDPDEFAREPGDGAGQGRTPGRPGRIRPIERDPRVIELARGISSRTGGLQAFAGAYLGGVALAIGVGVGVGLLPIAGVAGGGGSGTLAGISTGSVTIESSVAGGLIRAGGLRHQILSAVESGWAASRPASALEGVGTVNTAVQNAAAASGKVLQTYLERTAYGYIVRSSGELTSLIGSSIVVWDNATGHVLLRIP